MTTQHRFHFHGSIQSLSFIREDGVRVGIGVFQPGIFDVGLTDTEEKIRVTSGSMVINGVTCGADSEFVAPKGTRLVFEVAEPATYFCTYHS